MQMVVLIVDVDQRNVNARTYTHNTSDSLWPHTYPVRGAGENHDLQCYGLRGDV